MVASEGADAIEAMERFLAGIAPFDTPPAEPVMTVEMRVGRLRGSFELTERAARALREVLLGHVDPDDGGRCESCGGHLDTDLRCHECGRVGGVFGAAIAEHLTRAAGRRDG